MKIFSCCLFLFLSIQGCVFTRPDYKTQPTESHILKTDKEQLKEDIRLQKEHAKAAEKRRKELEKVSHKHRSDHLEKKIKKRNSIF